MNKELQDLAWSILPKEFKEEVKKMFQKDINTCNSMNQAMRCILVDLFGIHNLTSDEEGEEMLMVSRKQIDVLQGEIFKAIMNAHDADDWQDAAHYILDVMPRSFATLFGSKCLPDDTKDDTKEPKPAEPKKESRNLSQETANCDKHFDNILKDSFREHNRLHIAAMVIASIMGSSDWSDYRGAADEDVWRNMAKASLGVADALLAECEKGGADEN